MQEEVLSLKLISKGDVFSETNLTTKRPGTGINPMFWNKIIGKKSKDDINADIQIKKKNLKTVMSGTNNQKAQLHKDNYLSNLNLENSKK